MAGWIAATKAARMVSRKSQNGIPGLFLGAFFSTRSRCLGDFVSRFRLQAALETPHIAHGSGTDQHAVHPEHPLQRQFANRKGLFDSPHDGFGGSAWVASFHLLLLVAPAPFRRMRCGPGKTYMTALVAFTGLGRALADQRAGSAHFGGEVGDKGFLLAAGMNCLGLPLWAGDLDRFAILVEFDGEVGQRMLLATKVPSIRCKFIIIWKAAIC